MPYSEHEHEKSKLYTLLRENNKVRISWNKIFQNIQETYDSKIWEINLLIYS